MPDRTQDLKNHRQVAVACKNYTDTEIKKTEGRILSIVARNNVNYIDHIDEASYKITAPTNAKLLMLQSIGGNTVKLSPSVASDSTKAMIKTMPSTVYTFDGSKFYGDSEVSENLLVLSDVAQTTTNGVTYKIENGVLTIISTSNTSTVFIGISIQALNGTYTLASFGSTATNDLGVSIRDNSQTTTYATATNGNSASASITDSTPKVVFRVASNASLTNYVMKPMLVKGSTAPTEFKVGYTGIHNLELSGLKVWQNLYDSSNVSNGNASGNYTVSSFTATSSGITISNRGNSQYNRVKLTLATIVGKSYTFKANASTLTRIAIFDSSENIIINNENFENSSITFTATTTTTYILFFAFYTTSVSFTDIVITKDEDIMTKTIDLTTIVDSNNNKLFPNGKLMGYNDLKDVLGVYNQESKWNEVDLGTLNWVKRDDLTNVNCYSASFSNYKLVSNTPMLCANYNYDGTISSYGTMNNKADKTLCAYYVNNASGGTIYINDNAYATAEAFKTAMSGVMLQYERATYLTSNTDLSATLRNIQGYPNGSIIAENTHNMDVESVITYNSIIQETLCPSVTVEGANRFDNANTTLENLTFNNSNQTLYSYAGYALKVFNLTIGQTYTISSTKNMILGFTNDLNNSGTVAYGTSYTFTATTTYLLITNQFANQYEEIFENLMINLGSTALDYKPYKPSITRNLPSQASDGYSAGTSRNYRVFCDDEGNEVSKRENNVNKEDLGQLDWTRVVATDTIYFENNFPNAKTPIDNNTNFNGVCAKYPTTNSTQLFNGSVTNAIALNISNKLRINDTSLSNETATTFKTAMANEPLYYELNDASKTETDMDDFDYFFDVEEGDVITFNNPYAQQVYATYSFLIKEAKSNE